MIFAVFAGIALLLFLILRIKIQAFLALLISSMAVGLIAGMPPLGIIESMKNGMVKDVGNYEKKLPRSGFVHPKHIITHLDNHRIKSFGKKSFVESLSNSRQNNSIS